MKYITILGLIILSFSCRKDSPPEVAYFRFSPDVKEFVGSGEGKYRIYRDSATGEEDSVLITRSRFFDRYIEANPDFLTPAHYLEEFELEMNGQSSLFEGLRGNFLQIPNTYLPGSDANGIQLIRKDNNIAVMHIDHSGNNTLHNVTLHGRVFSEVIKVISTNNLHIADPLYREYEYWWARGIGIIYRRIMFESVNKTQTLIRFN